MFSTSGSSLIYLLYRLLNLPYALWLGIWCSFGSAIGLHMLNKTIKKLERQSILVITLALILGLSSFLVPIYAYLDIKDEIATGDIILKYNSIC